MRRATVMESLGSPVRAFCRLVAYAAWCLVMIPPQMVAVALGLKARERIPMTFHRVCCRIVGIRVVVEGEMSRARPTLFACNHTSYLDIMVLGSVIRGSFVAKAEVRRWPLFGFLARLQRTVFVVRDRRHAASQRDEILKRLEAGDNLILFPEGTSNDGNHVLPFKSALFAAATGTVGGRPVTVQPVSIAYTRLDGMPMGRSLRPFYAWYGDMDMATHLWQFAGLGQTTVVVRFHPAVTVAELGSRKALARYCEECVRQGVSADLSGRPVEPVQLAA